MSRKLVSALMLGAASAATNSTTTVTASAGAAAACSALTAIYGDAIITPSSANYTGETQLYWDIRANLKPACIFYPDTADDVVTAMNIFTENDAQFAVRGGGHMNFPGSNNIDGGVLMPLGHLNTITVDEDDLSFDVGPGTRWVDVYTALDPYGFYCVGGRLKTIGVPGLLLIGGFHYLINKYGFGMDNVLSYDVVLGNGTQVVANSTINPDLFWGLKGGANNLGLVTNFKMRALDMPEISTTIQAFDEAEIPAFIEAAVTLTANQGSDVAAGQVLSISYNATTGVSAASLLGVQEGTESPPSTFENFTAIENATMRIHNVTKPIYWHNTLETPDQMFRVQFAHGTIKATNASQVQFMYDHWRASLDELSDVEGLYPTFVLNTIPKGAQEFGLNNGVGNVWGLEGTEGLLIWQFSTGWDNAADDLRMTSWAQRTHDYLHSLNQEMGLSSEFLYMGDAGEFQNPFTTFPLENVQRLREVRSEYDAGGVFTRLNWGGFKLGF